MARSDAASSAKTNAASASPSAPAGRTSSGRGPTSSRREGSHDQTAAPGLMSSLSATLLGMGSALGELGGVGWDERPRRGLHDADVVAERVAQAAVDAVEALGRLVGELDALGLELLVGLAQVVGPQAEREARRALGDELADLLGRRVVVGRGPGALEEDLAIGIAGRADGQPAHEAHVDVGADLEAELADVEVQGLVLVEHEDG